MEADPLGARPETGRSALADNATFICGHPKSGTSLLRSLLDSHPQLVVYPEETYFFRRVLPQTTGASHEKVKELARRSFLNIFRWDRQGSHPLQERFPGRDYSSISYERVVEAFDQRFDDSGGGAGEMLSSGILAFGDASRGLISDTARWVEKTPYNELFSEAIFGLWPKARCLHVYRDPRDNYASYRVKHPEWWPETFAYSWRRSTSRGIRNHSNFGPDRYMSLRYEDLVRDPDAVMREVCSFLLIEFSAELVRPTRAGRDWAGNSMFGDEFARISQAPIDRWKKELEHREILLLETALGRQMVHLSYETSGTWDLRSWLQWVWYQMKRQVRSLLVPESAGEHA